jgi:hypothetical protein
MRIVACGLIAGAALLGPVPVAMADTPVNTANGENQAAPQTEVNMLAVSLTVGGALATVGSGMALALARRRKSQPSAQSSVRVTALRHCP